MERDVERAPTPKDSTEKCGFYGLDFGDPMGDISMRELRSDFPIRKITLAAVQKEGGRKTS